MSRWIEWVILSIEWVIAYVDLSGRGVARWPGVWGHAPNHRRSQGCSGCTCIPRAENIFRRNSQGKFVSAPFSIPSAPPDGARVNFRTFLLRQEDLELELVVLDRFLKATTTKKVVNFLRKKSTPSFQSDE